MPKSQAAVHPWHKEEEEIDKTKQARIEQTYENTKINSLFPKRGNDWKTQEQNNIRQD